MANLVVGAMANLIPKLYQLLEKEYKLQTGVKERITSLTQELEHAQAALCKVAEVPWDQLDKQVQLWAREVREASYDMEDILDTFLVRVQGPDGSAEQEKSLLKPLKKMTNLIKTSKARRKINGDVEDIMTQIQKVTERCRRYKVDDIVARSATPSTVDPRLAAMFTQVTKLVGIDKSSGELMSKLQLDDMSNTKTKIVSIVGIGGLGKTTLAKAVYDDLKAGDFPCKAFVSVGRNPNLQKVIQMILIELDKERYMQFNFASFQDITQFIKELRQFLHDKRCFIVIDDLWEKQSWETIKLAIDDDNNCRSRVIITTRKLEVAKKADEFYELPSLPYDSSRKLLYTRIYGDEREYTTGNKSDEISEIILRKCDGIPLAIITMASLLVGKPREKWLEVYKSIGFGCKDNEEAENTMRILSFSYYDLPVHLRTCLLYLSTFPEDSIICKSSLVWMWVAEGFVDKKEGISLFEIGEGYLNDLINRSMIQEVESKYNKDIIIGCRVHDMVLDFICSMSKEEKFSSVLGNDQGTLLQSNPRRLANHNKTIGHTHQASHSEMPKLRSFIALGCVIETWAPLSNLKLLRVLAIEDCKPMDGSCVQVEHIGYLLHLRFLSLRGTSIDRIPEGIGALKFLQTLDLWESGIFELPSCSSLPKQLACLYVQFDCDVPDEDVNLGERPLTSLEDLSIEIPGLKTMRWFLEGSLSVLRVLDVILNDIVGNSKETDLVEALRHLQSLQSVSIEMVGDDIFTWQGTELVLPCHLRHLAVYGIMFFRLPPCINPSCLPNLSHLDLWLKHMDEQDLKILSGLPELRYLCLDLYLCSSSPAISNITDSNDYCYFPKLRCCRLRNSMAIFVANQEDKSVSFHIWNGFDDIFKPSVVPAEELKQSLSASVSDDEGLKSDGKLQSTMPSVSDGELHGRDRPPQASKLQHGLAALALAYYYLLAFVQHVVQFLKTWSFSQEGQHPFISNGGSTSGPENAAAAPPPNFMPSLQALCFVVTEPAIIQGLSIWDNLGWGYLSSLREIRVGIPIWSTRQRRGYPAPTDMETLQAAQAALRRAAQAHPNRPTLRFY